MRGYNERWRVLWCCTCAQDQTPQWPPVVQMLLWCTRASRPEQKSVPMSCVVALGGHPCPGGPEVEHIQCGRMAPWLVRAHGPRGAATGRLPLTYACTNATLISARHFISSLQLWLRTTLEPWHATASSPSWRVTDAATASCPEPPSGRAKATVVLSSLCAMQMVSLLQRTKGAAHSGRGLQRAHSVTQAAQYAAPGGRVEYDEFGGVRIMGEKLHAPLLKKRHQATTPLGVLHSVRRHKAPAHMRAMSVTACKTLSSDGQSMSMCMVPRARAPATHSLPLVSWCLSLRTQCSK